MRRPDGSDPNARPFGRNAPLPEIIDAMDNDPLPIFVTDTVRDALVPKNPKRTTVAILMALGLAIGWALALFVTCATPGCTGANGKPITAGVAIVAVRKFGHEAAKGYCAVHVAATPLLIAAQGQWPAMIVPRAVADAFCARVADVEALARSVPRPLGYVIDPSGFDEIAAPSGGE